MPDGAWVMACFIVQITLALAGIFFLFVLDGNFCLGARHSNFCELSSPSFLDSLLGILAFSFCFCLSIKVIKV